jgi:hypothetical protein
MKLLFVSLYFIFSFYLYSNSQSSSHTLKKYSSNSVLSDYQSDWYKLSIKKDGFYKLTYEDLLVFGVDKSKLNSGKVHIYGNATGRLSEDNAAQVPDDLIKNSVQYFGMEDGKFDPGDFIVFYAFGPNKWEHLNNRFQRDINIYSNESFYFIRICLNEEVSAISPYSTLKSANSFSNSFDYYDIHELEDTSIVNGGQRWYGELFDNQLKYTIDFQLPSASFSSISCLFSGATNATQNGSYISINSEGKQILKSFLPTVSSDFVRVQNEFSFSSTSSKLQFDLELTRTNPSLKFYFDKIEINTRILNRFIGTQFSFRDKNTVEVNKVTEFSILSDEPIFVWDVTARTSFRSITLNSFLSGYNFIAETDSLREFAVGSMTTLNFPTFISKVANQNIHGLDAADLLIVTPKEFLEPASRLAKNHEKLGDKVHVLTLEQIYNEFSSGSVDPTAIKLCAKMFYERFKFSNPHSLKNVLLFGDGTFDPKNRIANNNYWVPTYQFLNSEDHLNAMVSDDYFGILADDGSIYGKDSMEIGVGRLLISSIQIANEQIAKIEQYIKQGLVSDSINCCGISSSTSFGDWRTNYVQITDDEENGYFVLNDSEPQYVYNKSNHSEMNDDKIYTDAFKQITMAGGERYPDVNNAIDEAVNKGALLIDYTGHGGEVGAAEERIITIPQINSWNNFSKLCLFVSSTCEFTKYDDPGRVSAGEWMSLNPNGGAIALMTTTRPVFFSVNTATGASFYKNVFKRDSEKRPLTFGEIIRRTKNGVVSDVNKHSFTLIGDPALRIALPTYKVVVDSINGMAVSKGTDTIRALSKVIFTGHVENQFGANILMDGELSLRVFDKPKQLQTLGQDLKSPIIPFENQENILFKGRSKVVKGKFSVSFIAPKDIDYSYGAGKISLYVNDSTIDGLGSENRFVVGGINNAIVKDSLGPKINMYLNDQHFVNNGLTNESPKLIIQLEDESGINTIGNGIGHDAVAILDNDVSAPILLNNYYVSNLDSYQKGRILYDFKGLSEGRHNVKVKVWDVYNNPSESTLDFIVHRKQTFELFHVLNYPNPFTSNTHFYFEHNQICNQLEAQIQIFTPSGKLVKTISEIINQQGFRSEGIHWDGKDDFGDKLAKGVYIYRLTVKNALGEISNKVEKIVIL